VSPATASIQVNAQQQFTATVHGNSDPTVTWDVNGTIGGNSALGTIDSISGLYTAPPTPVGVTVHASSSVVSPPAAGSASITVVNPAPPPPPPPVTVSISPSSASVRLKGTKQFTAAVTNTTNKAVTWYVNNLQGGNAALGTISANGLYQAPNLAPLPMTVTVTVISKADPGKTAHATVTLTRK
jgi:chitinase